MRNGERAATTVSQEERRVTWEKVEMLESNDPSLDTIRELFPFSYSTSERSCDAQSCLRRSSLIVIGFRHQPIPTPSSICLECFCTSGDADLEVQVSLLQVIQGHLLQPGPLQLGQALDRHGLQSHALTQHGRPRVVALLPGRQTALGRIRPSSVCGYSC